MITSYKPEGLQLPVEAESLVVHLSAVEDVHQDVASVALAVGVSLQGTYRQQSRLAQLEIFSQ